jgi:hypothetical protein
MIEDDRHSPPKSRSLSNTSYMMAMMAMVALIIPYHPKSYLRKFRDERECRAKESKRGAYEREKGKNA